MGNSTEYERARTVELSIGEFTGALGDSVTVLPIVVAIGALTEFSLGHMLLGFAAFQVVWGLYYGLPVSVEPMKALAALVIAGSLTASELAVAGLLAGTVLLGVGWTGTLGRTTEYIGQPVIRGVQLAVALILLETGVQLGLEAPKLALVAAGVATVVVLAGYRRASALVVLAIGVGITLTQTGIPRLAIPALAVGLPDMNAVSAAAIEGTVAQLAMTVGNAAVATSLLLGDYYDSDVSPDELATSMGAMNLVAIPFGAMPMCHGSGGVAGKYAFGARTAGSNLVLGGLYAITAVVGVSLVASFPLSMLGVVLALIAVELGQAGLETNRPTLAIGVGVLGLATNVGVAFVAGTVTYIVLERVIKISEPD